MKSRQEPQRLDEDIRKALREVEEHLHACERVLRDQYHLGDQDMAYAAQNAQRVADAALDLIPHRPQAGRAVARVNTAQVMAAGFSGYYALLCTRLDAYTQSMLGEGKEQRSITYHVRPESEEDILDLMSEIYGAERLGMQPADIGAPQISTSTGLANQTITVHEEGLRVRKRP